MPTRNPTSTALRLLGLIFALFAAFFFLEAALNAQIKPAQPQILWPPVTEPKLVTINPDGGLIYLKIGPDLKYDKLLGTLNARIYCLAYSVELLIAPVAPSLSWSTPTGCIPMGYFLNGRLQLDPTNFVANYESLKDRWLVDWQIGFKPVAGDVLAIQCVRNVTAPPTTAAPTVILAPKP